MAENIAGHQFDAGLCIAKREDGSRCCVNWLDIQYCDRGDIDKPNIAHSDLLSAYEADQIIEAKKKQDERWDILFNRRKQTGASP